MVCTFRPPPPRLCQFSCMVYLCRIDLVRKVWSDEFGRMLLDGRLFIGSIGRQCGERDCLEREFSCLGKLTAQ